MANSIIILKAKNHPTQFKFSKEGYTNTGFVVVGGSLANKDNIVKKYIWFKFFYDEFEKTNFFF